MCGLRECKGSSLLALWVDLDDAKICWERLERWSSSFGMVIAVFPYTTHEELHVAAAGFSRMSYTMTCSYVSDRTALRRYPITL